jgi:hypothetical protein
MGRIGQVGSIAGWRAAGMVTITDFAVNAQLIGFLQNGHFSK